VVPDLLATLAYDFAFIWLSPVAWEWDGKSGHAPRPRNRWWAGFLGAEFLALVLGAFQDLLYRLTGQPGLSRISYLGYLCLHGPGLFLINNLLSSRDRMEQEREEMRQRTESAIAEHLKGQVHPHVLFNTLNGLAELMQEDHEAAEALIESMSGFLHRVLEASQKKTWTLQEERALIQDFLDMEATRLGPRLRVAWEWDPACDPICLLPLVLQPLVENAVKHGVDPCCDCASIVIRAREDDGRLRVSVVETGEGILPEKGGGVGLANIRERLKALYGASAHLVLEENAPRGVVASIEVPA
jgi:LytS/YehU family sensor histidine kinase